VIAAIAVTAMLTQSPEQVIREIQRSHIEGNVPPAADFDRLLSRDLEKYFSRLRRRSVKVQAELLRDGPTQSGVAYPRFYVWVRVLEGETVVEEGAARVAAIDRKEFDVTDYLDAPRIRAKAAVLYEVFPGAVADKIKARLGIK